MDPRQHGVHSEHSRSLLNSPLLRSNHKQHVVRSDYWYVEPDYRSKITKPFSARLRDRKQTRQVQVAAALKQKKLATIAKPRITTFSLPYVKQEDSLFDRAPPEIRNMIYKLCGAKDSRVHLYELSNGVKGFNCEDYDLTKPCLGSAPCHTLVEKVMTMFPREGWNPHQCPTSCDCAPTNFLALSLTCQKFYLETLSVNYQTNMFVISKYMVANIITNDALAK